MFKSKLEKIRTQLKHHFQYRKTCLAAKMQKRKATTDFTDDKDFCRYI